VLSDLAWNTFRNHLILEYEILKYDGDLGRPNVFVPLSDEIGAQKIALLRKAFQISADEALVYQRCVCLDASHSRYRMCLADRARRGVPLPQTCFQKLNVRLRRSQNWMFKLDLQINVRPQLHFNEVTSPEEY
jgi:hypothetical protein